MLTPTKTLHTYDSQRDALIGKSADGCLGHEVYAAKSAAYWSVVQPREKRWQRPLWRRVWRWLIRQVWW
jgi:hypothetical protein